MDPADDSLLETALREAEEEIGLSPDLVGGGELEEMYIPPSDFRVSPFVGLLPPEAEMVLGRGGADLHRLARRPDAPADVSQGAVEVRGPRLRGAIFAIKVHAAGHHRRYRRDDRLASRPAGLARLPRELGSPSLCAISPALSDTFSSMATTEDRSEARKVYKDHNLHVLFGVTLMAVLGVSSITPALPRSATPSA